MIQNIFDALQKEYMNLTLRQQKELSSSVNVNRLEDELDRLNKMYQKGRISEEFYDVVVVFPTPPFSFHIVYTVVSFIFPSSSLPVPNIGTFF